MAKRLKQRWVADKIFVSPRGNVNEMKDIDICYLKDPLNQLNVDGDAQGKKEVTNAFVFAKKECSHHIGIFLSYLIVSFKVNRKMRCIGCKSISLLSVL